MDPRGPCHCGSGKDYKTCCLAKDDPAWNALMSTPGAMDCPKGERHEVTTWAHYGKKNIHCRKCGRRLLGIPQADGKPTDLNVRCPCGSGKKYKNCCLKKTDPTWRTRVATSRGMQCPKGGQHEVTSWTNYNKKNIHCGKCGRPLLGKRVWHEQPPGAKFRT